MNMLDCLVALTPQSMIAHIGKSMSGSNTNNNGSRIETHSYRTPMRDGALDLWSIGVLNITETEGKVIEQLARVLQNHRNDPTRLETITLALPSPVSGRPLVTYSLPSPADRQRERTAFEEKQRSKLSGRELVDYDREQFERNEDEAQRIKQNPPAPRIGDRFSGIEFDEQ